MKLPLVFAVVAACISATFVFTSYVFAGDTESSKEISELKTGQALSAQRDAEQDRRHEELTKNIERFAQGSEALRESTLETSAAFKHHMEHDH